MKIHMGCGARILPGWINIDIQKHPDAKADPEILADARKVPLPDGCASLIQAIHLWEHFYLWECDALIAEWRRLLKPGGVLVLELPDLAKCARNLLDGIEGKNPGQLSMWGIFGNPGLNDPYMCHRWGWTPKTLSNFLKENGFTDMIQSVPQYHPAGRERRDMRIQVIRA